MQQAARVSDHTAFMFQGEIVEYATTKQIFNSPKQRLTEDYIMGRFG
jgi:phosphate transport system ATP-binding protein